MAIIRVSGNVGSGKTTLCEKLAIELKYGYHYTGQIFRDMANEADLTIEEFYQELKKDPELEKSIDLKQMQLMFSNDNIIVQGRMAPFLSPFNHISARGNNSRNVINIFIKVSPEEGARRQLRRQDNKGKSLDDMVALSKIRMETEKQRLKELWGIENCFDESKFDLVLDTTKLTVTETYDFVLGWIRSRLAWAEFSKRYAQIWTSRL